MTQKRYLLIPALVVALWVALLLVDSGPPVVRVESRSDGPLARLVVEATVPTARQLEGIGLLEVGRGLYADEGLDLPEIRLVVQDSLQECNGRVGRYDERNNELWLCRIDLDTVLHELAHAWIDHNLGAPGRAEFVALRGLPEWNDRTQPWAERGSEQAAEIIMWAVSDRERTVRWVEDGIEARRLLSIDNSSPEDLFAGYELMVGKAPRRPIAEISIQTTFSPEAMRRG